MRIQADRTYLATHAPARPSTPTHAQNVDPIPSSPQYDQPPPYEFVRSQNERLNRIILHQNFLLRQSTPIDWNAIDPPPRASTDLSPRVDPYLNYFRLANEPRKQYVTFIIESVMVLTAARFDPDVIRFLSSPTISPYDLTDYNEITSVLIQHSFGSIPLLYLDKHWIIYHSNTPFESITDEYHFSCVEKLCPFWIIHRIQESQTDNFVTLLEILTRILTSHLKAEDLDQLQDYYIALARPNRPRSLLSSSSPLMAEVKRILTSFFMPERIPLVFIDEQRTDSPTLSSSHHSLITQRFNALYGDDLE
jgi:hypothetical protein